MSHSYFQFKQFTVWHDKCAMKVGTDGVLLGAWASVKAAGCVLDIGTGTGLVALMLAQRSEASIIALEMDEKAAEQAQENIARSPWPDRIQVLQQNFNYYSPNYKFDAIVSNPPYFIGSLKCPEEQRSSARHDSHLTYEALLKGVSALLSEDGIFTLIIPADVVDHIKDIAYTYSLYPYRQLNIITKPGGAPKRALISFTFTQQECRTEQLLTEISRHQYSEEYIALTKEFYQKM